MEKIKKEKPIRVAEIVGKYIGGGVESVVLNYFSFIDREKIQFDFICDSDSTDIPYEQIESMGGRVILIPPYQRFFKYQKELKRILKEGNYKIVHSHINALSIFPLRAAKKAGVPIRIAHSHSTSNKKEWKKNLIKNILKPFSKVYANKYMCCSELAGRWLFGNKEYDKGNVYLLNNAIDLDKYKYNEEARNLKRKEMGIKPGTFVVGHIGRFVEQKNHRFLIDIFNEIHKKNNNSLLLLAGQGPLMDEIKEKVHTLGLDNNVQFLGQRKDANELYQVFDLFLLPSLYEGLPVVGVEAQASGNLCYLSSDMTKETKVLDSTVFMSLENTAKEWANAIIKDSKTYKKHDTVEEVSKYGFNIQSEANKLKDYYIDCLKPKVLHITNSNIYSGLEKVSCQIIKNTKDDYTPIYITKKGPIIEQLESRKIDYEIIKKLNIGEIKRIIKKTHPSLIHAHDFTPSFIATLSSVNIPIISHIHQNPSWLKKVCIKSIIFLFTGLRTNKILTVSSAIENEYIFSNIIKKKMLCVSNPTSCREILKECNPDAQKVYDICCVGRVEKVKNPILFIEIIKEIKKIKKDVKAIWIGDGENIDAMKKLVCDYNMEDNISFIGFSRNPYEYMAQSRLFLLCSRWEGFGLVAFEALTLGLPCVVSNVGGLKNIVDNKCGKLCNKKEEYIEEIISLLSDKDNYIKKSKQAILKSRKIENYDQYFDRIKRIYKELLNNEE